MKRYITNSLLLAALAISACDKQLDVVPFAEFSPSTVLTSEAGARSVLFSAYAGIQISTPSRLLINASEVCTDVGFNSGGNENLTMSQIQTFTWGPDLGLFQADVWAPSYRAIRDANLVIGNIDNANMDDSKRKLLKAEARFVRAYAYQHLYNWFGPVPLRTEPVTDPQFPRATDAEMRTFIETELTSILPDLPAAGQEEAFGRANKGMVTAILAKYYLNTKQWQKAAEAAQQVIALNYYQLFPKYEEMFTVANERNKEMIYVIPCLNREGFGNWYTAGALPPGYKTSNQLPVYTWIPGMANFATQYRMRTGFTSAMDTAKDKRAILLIRRYINTSNANVSLLTTPDNIRSLKYYDNATVGNHSGNDVPVIRYADILISRAEALNELSGPTQEALDLLNQVRTRAGIDPVTLATATSKEALRTIILRERAWEFYSEGKRREDLLRHDLFISSAQARGITTAAEKHKLFPIPLAEVEANKLVVQNPGYN